MKEFIANFKNTFVFLKGHYMKYSLGICGMTTMRCTAALLQAYLLQYFLKAGTVEKVSQIAVLLLLLLSYIVVILVFLPVFQFWFNGEAKYGHGNVCKAIYHKYGKLGVSYFEKNHSGRLLSLFTNDTWLIAAIFMRHFRRVAAAVITIIIYLIPMFVLDYRITILLVVTNLLSMVVNVKMAGRIKKKTKEIQEKAEKLTETLTNMLSGMAVIRIYGMQTLMIRRFEKANGKVKNLMRKRTGMLAGLASYQQMIYVCNYFIFLVLGSVLVKMGYSTVADILAIMSLQTALEENFKELGEYYPQLINGMAATERLYEFLGNEEEKVSEAMEMVTDASYIEFQNVSFSYSMTEKSMEEKRVEDAITEDTSVFHNFNLKIDKGEHIAIVGESGCGKSTLVKLLLGMYPVSGGGIAVEGKSVAEMTLEQLHSLIAYVPQESELFHTSIFENIRYGRAEATEEEVYDAARKANADEFIRALPEGYYTIMEEQGSNLSGGQRQRIAIARALLKNAPIIVFDEATSALDNETEHRINESIRACQDKTWIVIAHRESALQNMHRIIDLSSKLPEGNSTCCGNI